MTVTLATMAFIFGTANVVDGKPILEGAQGPIALVAANLFVVAFGMSWGPVTWVLLGEIFPNRMRAAALSVAAGGQWVANWIITVTFPGLKDISPGARLRPLRGLRPALVLLRDEVHRGDQGQAAWRTCTVEVRLTKARPPTDSHRGAGPLRVRRRASVSALAR